MNRVRHYWPGTRPELRLVHDAHDATIRETRERTERVIYLDDSATARIVRAVLRLLRRVHL